MLDDPLVDLPPDFVLQLMKLENRWAVAAPCERPLRITHVYFAYPMHYLPKGRACVVNELSQLLNHQNK